MNGYRPCQTDGILDIPSYFFFLNFLFRFIEMITDIAPGSLLHGDFLSLFCCDIDQGVLRIFFDIVISCDRSQCSVHPLMIDVILDENDLCPWLQG